MIVNVEHITVYGNNDIAVETIPLLLTERCDNHDESLSIAHSDHQELIIVWDVGQFFLTLVPHDGSTAVNVVANDNTNNVVSTTFNGCEFIRFERYVVDLQTVQDIVALFVKGESLDNYQWEIENIPGM